MIMITIVKSTRRRGRSRRPQEQQQQKPNVMQKPTRLFVGACWLQRTSTKRPTCLPSVAQAVAADKNNNNNQNLQRTSVQE